MSYEKVLKEKFLHENFRDNQKIIIKSILEKKQDVSCIMFTGAGKSICYQFPPVYTNKIAIVISPLISLMDDQKVKLKKLNIKTICLNSSVDNKSEIKNKILNNIYRLVYTTPEYIVKQKEFIKKLNDTNNLILVAIDESHCLSSWGHDFRESYRELKNIKLWTTCPIIALTATATQSVENDIIKTLKLENPEKIKTTFNRPNLFLQIKKRKNVKSDLLPLLTDKKPTIIYCLTKTQTEKTSKELEKYGILSAYYHAGMADGKRKKVHNQFINSEINCIVATVAFGMGIDKTIRQVIHYGLPKDMESYYQEIGRAGRDGLRSDCYVYYSNSDIATNNYFLSNIKNIKYRNHKRKLFKIINKYVYLDSCRRKYILNYFGESYEIENCRMCDNCCFKKIKKLEDCTEDAIKLLKLAYVLKGKFGQTMMINILRGSNAKTINQYHKKLDQYNTSNKSIEWWKFFIREMIIEGFLLEELIPSGKGSTIFRTKKGRTKLKELESGEKLKLCLTI